VKESITLPPIRIRNIHCKASVLQRVVANAIPSEVRSLLHAGDVHGALQHLGVKSEDSMSLVKAVTENRNKELDRLKKTYDFKSSLEYATPQAKENALKSLKEKIASLEEQIKQLKERIENYKEEMCPICFDEPQNPTLTPCCSRIYCAGCILTSLTRQTSCPLCRAQISASGLRSLSTQQHEVKNEIVDPNAPPEPLKKTEQLLELIRSTPNGKFLVFSRYDNPFLQISQEIESMRIAVKQVRGNKDVIASTLKGFQKGDTKVLLLNSIEAGAGLNITAATHIILLHAMTHEEEKQILGRAYRLGRSEPLEVIRLLHPDELQHIHTQA
jgi:SNF2 family DNA or RNA helicase